MATIIAADAAAAAVLFASTSLTRVTLGSDVRVASVHDLIKEVLMTKNGPINFVHNFFPNSP
jgi:hypothetical protein